MFLYVACNVGILSAVSVLLSSYSAARSRRLPLKTERLERDSANERYWRERGGTFSYTMGAREGGTFESSKSVSVTCFRFCLVQIFVKTLY